MNNFTTLIPIERTGSLRQSLRHVTGNSQRRLQHFDFSRRRSANLRANRRIQADNRLSGVK
jgi:hypothetical protein